MAEKIALDDFLSKIIRFSGIGFINTLIHTTVVVLSVEIAAIHPVLANITAFIFANIFSYWANRRWNFRGPTSLRQYMRFMLVSSLGLMITVIVSGFVTWMEWNYWIGLGLIFILLPAFTFFCHWQWTFKS